MRRTAQYVAFVALLLGVALWTQVSRPKQFVWLPTYDHRDTQPLGCAVFDSVMAFTLPRGYEVTRKPLIQIAREDSASVRNVLVVDEDIVLWPGELDALFRMLERGAKVMLVANWFDRKLQDTLGVHPAPQQLAEMVGEAAVKCPEYDLGSIHRMQGQMRTRSYRDKHGETRYVNEIIISKLI